MANYASKSQKLPTFRFQGQDFDLFYVPLQVLITIDVYAPISDTCFRVDRDMDTRVRFSDDFKPEPGFFPTFKANSFHLVILISRCSVFGSSLLKTEFNVDFGYPYSKNWLLFSCVWCLRFAR